MTTKTNIVIDKILKGVPINKNNEINYTATIAVELEREAPFEYAIITEGSEDSTFIPFTKAKKFLIITHKNIDGIYSKKILLLKSSEKINAEISIEVDRIFNTNQVLETMGPKGTVLLNADAGAVSTETNKTASDKTASEKTVWYKDPWILGAIFVVVLLIAMFIMKKNSKNTTNSMFLD